MRHITADELDIAKSVDLVAVADNLGFTPKKIGRFYTLKEMDSIRIYDRKNWFRWSMKDVKGHNGGSQIDFLKEFAGMNFKEAVIWLLDFSGYNYIGNADRSKLNSDRIINTENNEINDSYSQFKLPEPYLNNYKLYSYLNKKRCISVSTIDYFVNHNLIYECDYYHNIIFKGNDCNGVTRQACQRGTNDISGMKPFKMDILGSNKNYGLNLVNDKSDTIVVFEGPIDLMSYVDIFQEYDANLLSLGMLSDRPLRRFLDEHSGVKSIILCLDNDVPGRNATMGIKTKYIEKGYLVSDMPVPVQYKDINEWLVATKISFNMVSENRPMYLKF